MVIDNNIHTKEGQTENVLDGEVLAQEMEKNTVPNKEADTIDEDLPDNPWDASVSALMDNEPTDFDPINLDMPYGRQIWDQYHLIGDIMRNPELAFQPSDMFYGRLSQALEQEPVHQAKSRSLWPWGLSVAAALVASVTVWLVSGHESAFNASPNTSSPSQSPQFARSAQSESSVAEGASLRDQVPATGRIMPNVTLALGGDVILPVTDYVAMPSHYLDLSLRDTLGENQEPTVILEGAVPAAPMVADVGPASATESIVANAMKTQSVPIAEEALESKTVTDLTTDVRWRDNFRNLMQQHNRTIGNCLGSPPRFRGGNQP